MSNNEYLMLRKEILLHITTVHNTRQVMYTSVAALLGFGFTQQDCLLFLLPLVVVIPSFLISVNLIDDIYRTGAYLNVFLEGGEFNWERRLQGIERKIDKYISTISSPFVFCASASVVMFLVFFDYSSTELLYLLTRGSACFAVLLSILYMRKTGKKMESVTSVYFELFTKQKVEELKS